MMVQYINNTSGYPPRRLQGCRNDTLSAKGLRNNELLHIEDRSPRDEPQFLTSSSIDNLSSKSSPNATILEKKNVQSNSNVRLREEEPSSTKFVKWSSSGVSGQISYFYYYYYYYIGNNIVCFTTVVNILSRPKS